MKNLMGIKTIVLSILCIAILLNCSGQKKLNFQDKKMAVISNSEYTEWLFGKKFSLWNPDDKDFDEVDEILISAIKDGQFYFLENKNLSEIRKTYRQYLCYFNEKGEKIVFINSFCELFNEYDEDNKPVDFDWKNKMIDISDGGDCHWNIKINLTTNKYFELKVNTEG